MRLKSLIYLCFTLILFSNCDDSFVVNANWKDITIIYGLLNQNDSIQYIKINKAFLNENTSAIELAKVTDSLYYKDSLSVILEEWNTSGIKLSAISLVKEFDNSKDSGIFSYPGQFLYKTPVTPLHTGSMYKLIVRNTKTGKEMTSQTTLVSDILPQYPPKINGLITFKVDNEYDVQWYSGKNAYFYDLTIDILYIEYPKNNSSLITQKVIHWPIFSYRKTPNLDGLKLMSLKLKGSAFFDLMSNNIPVNMDLNREFKGFDLIFSSGGQEIYYYIDVNKPSTGIIQKKPEYSNFNNALGVFSSRNQNVIHARLSSIGLDELKKNTKTIDLNFVK